MTPGPTVNSTKVHNDLFIKTPVKGAKINKSLAPSFSRRKFPSLLDAVQVSSENALGCLGKKLSANQREAMTGANLEKCHMTQHLHIQDGRR